MAVATTATATNNTHSRLAKEKKKKGTHYCYADARDAALYPIASIPSSSSSSLSFSLRASRPRDPHCTRHHRHAFFFFLLFFSVHAVHHREEKCREEVTEVEDDGEVRSVEDDVRRA